MSGGPWIQPENAMRTIVYSRADVTGKQIETLLPVPEPNKEEWRNYRDIAVLAFPTPAGDTGKPLVWKQLKGDGNFPWRFSTCPKRRATLGRSQIQTTDHDTCGGTPLCTEFEPQHVFRTEYPRYRIRLDGRW